MQKIRSHEWDIGIQGCRINGGWINEGRLYSYIEHAYIDALQPGHLMFTLKFVLVQLTDK